MCFPRLLQLRVFSLDKNAFSSFVVHEKIPFIARRVCKNEDHCTFSLLLFLSLFSYLHTSQKYVITAMCAQAFSKEHSIKCHESFHFSSENYSARIINNSIYSSIISICMRATHVGGGGENEQKICLSFTRAQHRMEYLRFEYFMPHASQLHLQFHVIQVLSKDGAGNINTLFSLSHLYIVNSLWNLNYSSICGEREFHCIIFPGNKGDEKFCLHLQVA